MNDAWSIDIITWITAVEIPALAGLFWLIWRTRRDLDHEIEHSRQMAERGISSSRDNLSAYKLEVAKSYASIAYIKDIERRLTSQLTRIENKLDSQGLNSGPGRRP